MSKITIYALIFPDGSSYVGASPDPGGRVAWHIRHAASRKHHNQRFAETFARFGKFEFAIRETCAAEQVGERKAWWLGQISDELRINHSSKPVSPKPAKAHRQEPVRLGDSEVAIYALNFPDGSSYVGASRNPGQRAAWHLRHARKGTHYNQRVAESFKKFGGFEVTIHETCDVDASQEREHWWIQKVPEGLRLNIRASTEISPGRTLTPDQVRHMRSFKKPMSDENKAKLAVLCRARAKRVQNVTTGEWFENAHLAAAAYGLQAHALRICARNGKPRYGGYVWLTEGKELAPPTVPKPRGKQNLTAEQRLAKGERFRKLMSKPVQNIDTGDIYPSAKAAATALGQSSHTCISAAATGRQKFSGGYRWRYVHD